MRKTMISAAAASFFASTMAGFSMYFPQSGEGQARAAVRLRQHRDQQAARVAPALAVLAEKRKIALAVRRARWMKDRDAQDLLRAPRHIQAAV